MSPPIRNRMRRRTSPKRAASPSTPAGFWAELTATGLPVSLGLLLGHELRGRRLFRQRFHTATSLLDGLARTLGGADAHERNGLGELARQHDLGAIGRYRDQVGFL